MYDPDNDPQSYTFFMNYYFSSIRYIVNVSNTSSLLCQEYSGCSWADIVDCLVMWVNAG